MVAKAVETALNVELPTTSKIDTSTPALKQSMHLARSVQSYGQTYEVELQKKKVNQQVRRGTRRGQAFGGGTMTDWHCLRGV